MPLKLKAEIEIFVSCERCGEILQARVDETDGEIIVKSCKVCFYAAYEKGKQDERELNKRIEQVLKGE